MSELAKIEEERAPPANLMEAVMRAAIDPRVDVAKMQALLVMQEQVETKMARRGYVAAKMALTRELPSINRRGAITNKAGAVQSTYSRWEDIHRIIKPLLDKNGFDLSFNAGTTDKGMMTVEAILTHVEGHQERSGHMPLPNDTTGAKSPTQGVGSTFSYGKRYTTIALLNIVTEDDKDAQKERAADPGELDLIDQARRVATQGMNPYLDYWSTLSTTERRRLIETGDHEKNKAEADKADQPGYVAPNFDNLQGGDDD